MKGKSALELTAEVASEMIGRMVEDMPGFLKEIRERVHSSPEMMKNVEIMARNQIVFMKKSDPKTAEELFGHYQNVEGILKDVKFAEL